VVSNIPKDKDAGIDRSRPRRPDRRVGALGCFNIPPDTLAIKEKTVPGTEALNDFGNFYYGGRASDQKLHHYIFTLYALDAYLDSVDEGATKDTLEKAMAGKIIASARLTGVYQNIQWK